MATKRTKIKTIKFYDTPNKPKFTLCKSYDIPLYPCSLHIGIEDDLESGIAVTYNNGSNHYVIFDREFMLKPSIVSHEAFHVLENLSDYLGKGLTGEAGAYMIEWIVETILESNKKEKKFKKSVKK